MKLNIAQKDIINTFINDNIAFVNASAGTGKTTTLVEAYISLLEKKIKVYNIVVITFTKAAANEMLSRIRARVRKNISNASSDETKSYWAYVYNDLIVNARISTIDSLASSITKEHALSLNLPAKISILSEEDDMAETLNTAIESLLEKSALGKEIYSRYNLYLNETKNDFVENLISFINNINPRLKSIENCESKINLIIKPDKTEEEIISILSSLDVYIKDIILCDENKVTIQKIIRATEEFNNILSEVLKINSISKIEKNMFYNFFSSFCILKNMSSGALKKPEHFVSSFDNLKDILMSIEGNIKKIFYKKDLETLRDFITLSYNKISDVKKSMGIYSYDDIVIKASDALENTEISHLIRDGIDALILDEAQDTNSLQFSFISLLISDKKELNIDYIKRNNKKLFIVGDRKQSIYRFRNADIKSFTEAKSVFGDNVKSLQYNYRSSHSLINFFNNFFENTLFADDEIINYDETDNLFAGTEKEEFNNSVSYLKLDSTEKTPASEARTLEAKKIAEYISENYTNRLNDITILMSRFSNIDIYLNALSDYKIPFYVIGGRNFYERDEIKDIVYFLRYLIFNDESLLTTIFISMFFDLNVDEVYSFINELNINSIKLDDYISIHKEGSEAQKKAYEIAKSFDFAGKLENFKLKINDLQKKAFSMKCSSLIDAICFETDYYAYIATKNDNELSYSNIEKLKEIATDYESKTGNTSYDFVNYLVYNDNISLSLAPVSKLEINAVRIMTIHQSKGLEFPITFLASLGYDKARPETREFYFIDNEPCINILDDKNSKLLFSNTNKADNKLKNESEKNRLLYVALTRASESLVLSGEGKPSSKNIFCGHFIESEDMPKKESDFLKRKDIDVIYYSKSKNECGDNTLNSILDSIDSLKSVCKISDEKPNNKIYKKAIYEKPSENVAIKPDEHKNQCIENIENLLSKKLTYFEEHEGIIEEYEYDDSCNENKEAISAMNLGTILHSIFEVFDFDAYKQNKKNYKNKLIAKTLNMLSSYNAFDIENTINNAFNNFLENKHIQNIISGKEILVSREDSFQRIVYDENENKIIINGRLDLITKDDNNYYIIDYKTIKYRAGIYEKYSKQLNIYKDFISESYNISKDNVITELLCLK